MIKKNVYYTSEKLLDGLHCVCFLKFNEVFIIAIYIYYYSINTEYLIIGILIHLNKLKNGEFYIMLF